MNYMSEFIGGRSGQEINRLFLGRLATPEGQQKIAEGMQNFVRERVREYGVTRRALGEPHFVMQEQLVPGLNSDQLYKIVDLEPNSMAFTATFGGTSPAMQLVGKRGKIPLKNVMSAEFEKTEEELLAYSYPVHRLVMQNSVKDIYEQEDLAFMNLNLTAVNATRNIFVYAGALSRNVLSSLFQLLDIDMRAGDVAMLVMHKATLDSFTGSAGIELGLDLSKEITIGGYTYPTLIGSPFVATKLSTVVPPGMVIVLSQPEWLGQFIKLSDLKFFIEKRRNVIKFSAWESLGLAYLNGHGVGIAVKSGSGINGDTFGLGTGTQTGLITAMTGGAATATFTDPNLPPYPETPTWLA